MDTATADRKAPEFFDGATIDDIKTAYVASVVQVSRFTATEAAHIQRWATLASIERIGVDATAEWITELHSAA